jgi:hypothetical protein
MKIVNIVAVNLLLLIALATAWDWDTHQALITRVFSDINLTNANTTQGCLEAAKAGSIAPDKDFHDTANHHDYNAATCVPSQYYTCPMKLETKAIGMANEWLAKPATGCDAWYNVGVASHYWFDAHSIWHQVQEEDYDKCHKPFEDKVGEEFKAGAHNWDVKQCNETVTEADFGRWIGEFETKLNGSQKAKNEIGITLPQISLPAINLTDPITLCVAIVAIIAIGVVIFIIFGD